MIEYAYTLHWLKLVFNSVFTIIDEWICVGEA